MSGVWLVGVGGGLRGVVSWVRCGEWGVVSGVCLVVIGGVVSGEWLVGGG